MAANAKVGIITGGASGIGLEVAKFLAEKGWILHLFDLNEEAGEKVTKSIANSHFYPVDVTKWESLSLAFDKAFNVSGHIDFVFANAGIVERHNFYAKVDQRPPPEPNLLSVDINYKSVVSTAYLAQQYFRSSPHEGKGAVLVMTASCGAFYPSQFCPLYSGAKAGVVNFMRSIAFPYHHYDGVRTYAICPGSVRTGILNAEEWKLWPEHYFTDISKVSSTVEMLIEGGDMEDSWGKKVPASANYGLAVEIYRGEIYFRDQVDYCDEVMKEMMEKGNLEYQVANFRE
ncbi:uncharacterized protein JN550_008435 [Neoarthrinium moseri]|uniref:uncharacterized protein n=1 Tax=Neoarthrinium moseri TaxID=1658444 RepID=UPI001FDCDE48|nr:uncharacterized protein JN550_008435 [Neoarthrinium moseri]KAI1865387.1 hypothetical protein JN550_008435 [Neoarthrinium moseri]